MDNLSISISLGTPGILFGIHLVPDPALPLM